MTILTVFILSLVEGLTEFLPVSSTGHLILTSALLGLSEDSFVQSFNIIVQAGAIFSVFVVYRERFYFNKDFYLKLFVSFLPAAVLGLLFKKKIELLLGSPSVVATSLIVGGVILIASDFVFKDNKSGKKIEELSLPQCLAIGFIQCFAFIPGVSRSAATILAGLGFGLDKKSAAEYSFFLAVPTLIGASLVKGIGIIPTLKAEHLTSLALGSFLSFVFAILALKFFIRIVATNGFKYFGIYRILVGLAVFYVLGGS
jgi:undecaprenyl-diphosphatase